MGRQRADQSKGRSEDGRREAGTDTAQWEGTKGVDDMGGA